MVQIHLSFYQITSAVGIAILGATLQGSIGFGLGLISVPMLAHIYQRFVPGPIILAALLLNLLMSYRERESIDIRGLKWPMLGRFLGTFMGAVILTIVPQQKISIVFGLMVLLAVFLSISGLRLSPTPGNEIGAGTLSGIMATVAAIGGPPLALIYQNLNGSQLRGTLSGIFVLGTILSLGALVSVGKFGLQEIFLAFILFPGILIGFLLSRFITKWLDKGFLRPAVLIVSFKKYFLKKH